MPKIKTRKSIFKRFKVSKKGKVIRNSQYAGHRRSHKTKRRIRTFKEPKILGIRQAKIIKSLIGK